ncbi:MAG: DUF2934 domain-containing protein, partial [Deltaproteobacteria bacterium]|nr:DUF2934 domain-containing protein [Deltaproteobacteria bacterium]
KAAKKAAKKSATKRSITVIEIPPTDPMLLEEETPSSAPRKAPASPAAPAAVSPAASVPAAVAMPAWPLHPRDAIARTTGWPPPPLVVTPLMRHRMIAEAAYFEAEHRGFAPGRELDDWLEGERQIDAWLASHQRTPVRG